MVTRGAVVLWALFMAGCCTCQPIKPKVVEVRDDGCWKMDDCNWCCPIDPLDPNSASSCTLMGCVKEMP